MNRLDEISRMIEFQAMTVDELLAVADYIEVEFNSLNKSEDDAFEALNQRLSEVHIERVKLLALSQRMDFLLRRAVEELGE